MNDYQFGKHLGNLRKENNITQQQLGAMLGLPTRVVSKWENGTAKPKNGDLQRLASLFGLSKEQLLYDTRYETVKSHNKSEDDTKNHSEDFSRFEQSARFLFDKYRSYRKASLSCALICLLLFVMLIITSILFIDKPYEEPTGPILGSLEVVLFTVSLIICIIFAVKTLIWKKRYKIINNIIPA